VVEHLPSREFARFDSQELPKKPKTKSSVPPKTHQMNNCQNQGMAGRGGSCLLPSYLGG
jgi:hypothetical protein